MNNVKLETTGSERITNLTGRNGPDRMVTKDSSAADDPWRDCLPWLLELVMWFKGMKRA